MAQYCKLPIKAFRKRFGTSGSKSFRGVERHTLNLLKGFVLTFCWLDGLSNIIERHFFQFQDLLVAGTNHPLNSRPEFTYLVAKIGFVGSATGALVAPTLIVASVRIGPSVAIPVIAVVSPMTRFCRGRARQHHYYRA